MFLLLVDFPDETTGSDHLHIRFTNEEEIGEYLEWFRISVGAHSYEVTESAPCPRCSER